MIFDHYVPRQGRAVRENDVVTYPAVMCYVGLGHEQVAGSYFGQAAALLGAPVQGHKLPKSISLSGKQPASFAAILEVRRVLARGHEREEDATAPKLRWAVYYAVTGHSHVVVKYDIIPDDRVWTYDAITSYFSLGADYCCRVN
jgi:hypothetical protein